LFPRVFYIVGWAEIDRLFDIMRSALRLTNFLLALQLVNAQSQTYLCPLEFRPYPEGAPSCVEHPIQVTSAPGCRTEITVRASIYPVPSVQQIIIPQLPPGASLRLQGLVPESKQYSSQDLSSYMVGYNATFDWTPQLEHAGNSDISTLDLTRKVNGDNF
jgi:hypothetical protein